MKSNDPTTISTFLGESSTSFFASNAFLIYEYLVEQELTHEWNSVILVRNAKQKSCIKGSVRGDPPIPHPHQPSLLRNVNVLDKSHYRGLINWSNIEANERLKQNFLQMVFNPFKQVQ